MIRVVLVDDEQLMRGGLRMMMESTDDIEVVGEAGDGREAIDLVGQLKPDVVLMDIRMPGMDGLAATEELARAEEPVAMAHSPETKTASALLSRPL